MTLGDMVCWRDLSCRVEMINRAAGWALLRLPSGHHARVSLEKLR